MLTLLGLAHAAVPWECPAIVSPVDAHALRDTDAGLDAVGWDVYALAAARVDEGCAWVETTSGDGVSGERRERLCETVGSTVAIAEWWGSEWYYETVSWSGWELEVTVSEGETWTRILVRGTDDTASEDDWTLGPRRDVRAEWDGAIDGLPDDGWFTNTSGGYSSSGLTYQSRVVETPGCRIGWARSEEYGDTYNEQVSTSTQWVAVSHGNLIFCPDAAYAYASVDGVMAGAVDVDTWELDPADLDRDGWIGANDCDEADPERHACGASDTAGDGVDQDCDGVDGRAEPDGGDTADTGGTDTGPADPGDTADPDDTGASDTPEDTGPSGGPEPERPIASTTREDERGCFAGGAGLLPLLLFPLRRRIFGRGPPGGGSERR